MSTLLSSAVGTLHEKLLFERRIDVLSNCFAKLAPRGVCILDVGCGNGLIAALLRTKRPDIDIRGIDVLSRSHTHIPVEIFDGIRIPFADASFDVVLFSDVLHHTNDPTLLQREARRVSSQYVLIKDHYCKGFAARERLRFMDWVGNARFGVALSYNYWTEKQWHIAWQALGLKPEQVVTRLGLYPPPVDWLFGSELHFIALLKKCDAMPA